MGNHGAIDKHVNSLISSTLEKGMLMLSIKNFHDNDIYVMKRVGDTIVINIAPDGEMESILFAKAGYYVDEV